MDLSALLKPNFDKIEPVTYCWKPPYQSGYKDLPQWESKRACTAKTANQIKNEAKSKSQIGKRIGFKSDKTLEKKC